MDVKKYLLIPSIALLTVLSGCSKDEKAAESDAAPKHDIEAEIQAFYKTKFSIPPKIQEAYEAGKISDEELDKMKAEGKFKHYFEFKTIDDLPEGLAWDDGMSYPDLGDPKAKKGGTYHYFLQDFPRTLRTVGPDANGGFRHYFLDDSDLWMAYPYPESGEVTENGFHYYPGLADRWAVDKPNKTVYIHINPKARFSDGEEVTTEDVAFTFFFRMSDYVHAPWGKNYFNTQLRGITVFDKYTFAVHIPEAKPDILGKAIEFSVYPRHFYDEFGEDYVQRYQWRFKPTTGAYEILQKDIIKGRMITMTKVKDWWAKDNKYLRNRFNFDRVQFVVVRDIPKAFEMFKRGDIDAFNMMTPEYQYDKMPDDDDLIEKGYIHKAKFYNDIPRPTYGLYINNSRPYLKDVNVRKGVSYASNWQLVLEKFYRNDAVRMNTDCDGYGPFSNRDIKAYPFDTEKALEYFAKAGFTKRGEDGILVNDKGDRLSFTLTTGYPHLQAIMEILEQEARKAGLEFRLEVLDSTAAWKKVQEKKHDISFTALGVSVEVYPRYWEMWHSDNAYKKDGSLKPQTNNLCVYSNPKVDELISKYRASSSADEMIQLAHEISQQIHDDAAWVPGFVIPFLRRASWRWVRYPENGIGMKSDSFTNFWMQWIDEDIEKETKEAIKKGVPLKKEYFEWDQYNVYK